MTFSIAAIDRTTGMIGAATTTSDLAIGARVPWVATRVGAVLTQHTTDPRLGPRGLDLLASGCTPDQAVSALVASAVEPHARQLAVVDAAGRASVWDGDYVDQARAFARAGDGYAVVGNVLASPEVGAAIERAFLACAGDDLADRLLAALVAGASAGGEGVPLVSAALKVHRDLPTPYEDLRVDASSDPLTDLIALHRRFAPRRDEYVARAVDPDVSYAFEEETHD
ncbi:DUF1028 domain-containing protein [Demequina sp. NBRC 110054]|uniref:DUF1028 domain-containing protein n=1 Tax=Demequina sp. NBRC 110054 TaxID=1570343 RepID=UPI000A02D841|nr:DUF1028 domain-containing protein [Demequina sp. NBRC 110054]